MMTIEINIGGHSEVVRWWSANYWKMRKFRQKEFVAAVEARKRMWEGAYEVQRKARTGPRPGSAEWVEQRRLEHEAQYAAENLDQNEEVMPGADANRVAAFLAYDGSRKHRLNKWARTKTWSYWRTTSFYQAVMHRLYKELIRRTNHKTGLYDLNAAEKIRVGRLKGDGYHGCGVRQKPRYDRSHGIG